MMTRMPVKLNSVAIGLPESRFSTRSTPTCVSTRSFPCCDFASPLSVPPCENRRGRRGSEASNYRFGELLHEELFHRRLRFLQPAGFMQRRCRVIVGTRDRRTVRGNAGRLLHLSRIFCVMSATDVGEVRADDHDRRRAVIEHECPRENSSCTPLNVSLRSKKPPMCVGNGGTMLRFAAPAEPLRHGPFGTPTTRLTSHEASAQTAALSP